MIFLALSAVSIEWMLFIGIRILAGFDIKEEELDVIDFKDGLPWRAFEMRPWKFVRRETKWLSGDSMTQFFQVVWLLPADLF